MSLRRPIRLLLGLGAGLLVCACGGGSSASVSRPSAPRASNAAHRSSVTRAGTGTASTTANSSRAAHPPLRPHLLPAATGQGDTPFVPAVSIGGHTAVWIARRSGVALLSIDQRWAALHLHSGTIDAGATGWRWGAAISSAERRTVIAGFNGGFRLSTGAGGFVSGGRTAVPLQPGVGSIVTYADGRTDIGAWRQGLPAPGRRVASVRQNLRLLIDHGRASSSIGCLECWGATLGGVADPARSALGITADGHLVWAGGEHLTVSALAATLQAARVVRAVELDINPEWVAGYLYGHGRHALVPVPLVPGQPGIPGQLLTPDSRDFFTVVAR